MFTYLFLQNNPDALLPFNKHPCAEKVIPLQCMHCKKVYYRSRHVIKNELRKGAQKNYCSLQCSCVAHRQKRLVECRQCGNEFYKFPKEIRKSNNNFCSKKCAGTFNVKHRKGTRRSKLEVWLEAELTARYPDLDIDFNGKEAIGSELDIYIPSLKLAFELNGIFHYEPVYGANKLGQIRANDQNKFQACQAAGIGLCIIDTSGQKYFKPASSQRFLDIITNLIDTALPVSG